MRLQEAIEIATDFCRQESALLGDEFAQTIALVIEAGKLVEGLRAGVPRHIIRLLPGETEE